MTQYLVTYQKLRRSENGSTKAIAVVCSPSYYDSSSPESRRPDSMNNAQQAIEKLEGTDDDWPSGTWEEVAAWLQTRGIIAKATDFDPQTTGWLFPDGSVADEEIRESWGDVVDMFATLADRSEGIDTL